MAIDEVFKSFKEESKNNWGVSLPKDKHPSYAQIQFGAILRIADALELIASDTKSLKKENDLLNKLVVDYANRGNRLQRSINAYKGILKRNKKGK